MSYLDDPSRRGWASWVFTTDHKRIGLLYLAVITAVFWVAVGFGLTMRIKHLSGGDFLISPQTYNALFTLHGVIMIFLFVIPGIPSVFGNFFLPILIGARDVAFPRINIASWWTFVAGASLSLASLFFGHGPPDTGWTFYVPFSLRTSTNVPLATFGVFVMGLSSIMTGLNFITTIHRLRCPGMTWHRMPLFAWAIYATSWIQVLVTPIIGMTFLLIIGERFLGFGVFDPSKGGDPLIYQHLFWIYSHPAVYIMIVPAMGLVTEVLPTFARRSVFGYTFIAYSSLAIAALGSLVWAHHMFTSGMPDVAAMVFSLFTFLVAIPSAIKVFNWTATLYKGSIDLHPAMLYALAFVFLFSIGGLTGIIQGALAINVHVHDTYWIVGHFHYVMFGGTGFAYFSGLLYWFPKLFGRLVPRKPAAVAWLLMFLGFMTFYGTFLVLGTMGMPRRYYAHLPQFHTAQLIASGGAFTLVAGLLVLYGSLFYALLFGERAGPDPWGGKTLEWTVASPPPSEDFDALPSVTTGPYEYNPRRPA